MDNIKTSFNEKSGWSAWWVDINGDKVGEYFYSATKEGAAFHLGADFAKHPEKYLPQVETLF